MSATALPSGKRFFGRRNAVSAQTAVIKVNAASSLVVEDPPPGEKGEKPGVGCVVKNDKASRRLGSCSSGVSGYRYSKNKSKQRLIIRSSPRGAARKQGARESSCHRCTAEREACSDRIGGGERAGSMTKFPGVFQQGAEDETELGVAINSAVGSVVGSSSGGGGGGGLRRVVTVVTLHGLPLGPRFATGMSNVQSRLSLSHLAHFSSSFGRLHYYHTMLESS